MTSRVSSSKRPPSTSTAPSVKPKCQFHPSAVIAEKAQLTGSHFIELDENVILHPYAKVKADYGSVRIGKNSTVSETAIVGLEEGSEGEVALDANVIIETGAVVQAKSVGEGSVVGAQSRVGAGAVVGRYCKITPSQEVKPGEVLPDFTVVYADNKRRVDRTMEKNEEIRTMKLVGHEKQIELYKRLIPNAASKWM